MNGVSDVPASSRDSRAEVEMEGSLASHEVNARAVRGVTSLLARQLIVRVLGLAGMLVLARVLTPEMFGIFAIAQFVILFFEQISNLGLAAALIRKQQPVTETELRTVFSVQQLVVGCSMIVILVCAPLLAGHYGLDRGSEWLFRAMAVGLLLASLKTVPTVLLERRVRHDLVAASEVAEHLAYQVTAVSLALLGFGVWALVAATLIRGVTGLLTLCAVSWWRPRFGCDWSVLKELARFSVPIQLSSLFGLVCNAVIPVLVGSRLGPAAAGYANFSRTMVDALVFQPIILMGRVQFPVFSRVQQQRERLRAALERSIYIGSLLTFFMAALIVSQARPFVDLVITAKWAPALGLLYVLAPAYLAQAVAQPVIQALKALGDAKTAMFSSLLQACVQVAIFLALVASIGLISYAVGVAVGLLLSMLLALQRIRRHVPLNVWKNAGAPLVCAVVACAASLAVNTRAHGLWGMLTSAACCALVHFGLLALLSGDRFGREIANVITTLIPRSALARSAANGVAIFLARMHCIRS